MSTPGAATEIGDDGNGFIDDVYGWDFAAGDSPLTANVPGRASPGSNQGDRQANQLMTIRPDPGA